MRQIVPGDSEKDRVSPGRKQQRVVCVCPTALDSDGFLCDVDGGRPRTEHEINRVLYEELRRAKRDPFFGRPAREVVLREVRAIARWRCVRAKYSNFANIAFVAKC